MSKPYNPEFSVPDELQYLVDGSDVQQVHELWQDVDKYQINDAIVSSITTVDLGDRFAQVAVHGKPESDTTLVVSLPHQQRYTPAQAVLSMVTRQIVAPDSRMIVMASDTVAYTADERKMLASGDLRPHTEARVRVLEKMGVGKTALTGYSLGARTVVGMAALESDLNITHINADEAPSRQDRTVKELKKDFLKSGGFGDQLKAVKEGGIPVLQKVFRPDRLAVDYARFGLNTLRADNRALEAAMAGSMAKELSEASANYPTAIIKLGAVAGSRLFDISDLTPAANIYFREHSGDAAHGHTTGNNPMALALMVREGLGRIS